MKSFLISCLFVAFNISLWSQSVWNEETSPTSETLLDIASDGVNRIAVGENSTIVLSTLQNSWHVIQPPIAANFRSVTWSDKRFFIGGSSGVILSSPNGEAWEVEESGIDHEINDILSLSGTILAIGSNKNIKSSGIILRRHPSGNWESLKIFERFLPVGMAYGNGRYVIAGNWLGSATGTFSAEKDITQLEEEQPTYVFSSTDLLEWTRWIPPFDAFNGIAFGNGVFVLHYQDFYFTTIDGEMWQQGRLDKLWFESINYANGLFFAGLNPHGLLSSSDGINWRTQALPSFTWLKGFALSTGKLTAVGSGGVILSAPLELRFIPPHVMRGKLYQPLYGASKSRLILESSEDLNVWQVQSILTNAPNPYYFEFPTGKNIFFRALEE
ncbi:MAG: hypothetical protein ACO1QB_17825 [Verrucomicrobiales bacterium]